MFSILTRNREIVPSLEQNSEHLPSFHEKMGGLFWVMREFREIIILSV